MNNYSERALQFCHNVVADVLPNRKCCNYEKQAAQRHLNDLVKVTDPAYLYYFDAEKGNRVCAIIEQLQHTKGKWRGEKIKLEDFQIFIIISLFGWCKKSTGFRRFNKLYIELPRKNGKSLLLSALGLVMAFCDNEPAAEVYAGSQTEAMAHIVFQPAFMMAKMNTEFSEYFNLQFSGTNKNPTSIYNPNDLSKFIPVVGSPGDGMSPACGVIDEYHEAPTSVLYDCFSTGMGSRRQPLLAVITTAGTNQHYPCYVLHQEVIKLLNNTMPDDQLFAMLYAPDETDDWQLYSTWEKCNPNLNVSIENDFLLTKYNDALNKPGSRNVLLCKHLNLWANASSAWCDALKWEKCKDETLKLEDFAGQEAFLSLDLASKVDLCALDILFKFKKKVVNETCPVCYSEVEIRHEHNVCTNEDCDWQKPLMRNCVALFAIHYLPSAAVEKKENGHYQRWVAEGWLVKTEGERTDFQRVEEDIRELSKMFIVKELVFDPHESAYLIQNIQQWCNFECVEFTQSPALISLPMKELEGMVYANEIWHNGNPVLTWCISNIVKKQNRSGGSVKYYFPCKENDALKIDSGVAAIMGIGRLMVSEDDGDGYEERVQRGEKEILRVI